MIKDNNKNILGISCNYVYFYESLFNTWNMFGITTITIVITIFLVKWNECHLLTIDIYTGIFMFWRMSMSLVFILCKPWCSFEIMKKNGWILSIDLMQTFMSLIRKYISHLMYIPVLDEKAKKNPKHRFEKN
jgi:hypothetical protein